MFENHGHVENAQILTSERPEFDPDSALCYVCDFGHVTAFNKVPDASWAPNKYL